MGSDWAALNGATEDEERTLTWLRRGVERAVHRYNLIREGDTIAVALSGGKDSRLLLELLYRGLDIPARYEVIAVHVDGSAVGLPDLREPLRVWLESLGVRYAFVPLHLAPDEPRPPSCFRCTWNRRKALFLAAERLGCNVVALGHHADDVAITTLMNLFYKGRVEGLAPTLNYFDGRFRLIRPLILLEEAAIVRYARLRGWSFSPELACPRSTHNRRYHLRRLLNSFPPRERKQIRANLIRLGMGALEAREAPR